MFWFRFPELFDIVRSFVFLPYTVKDYEHVVVPITASKVVFDFDRARGETVSWIWNAPCLSPLTCFRKLTTVIITTDITEIPPLSFAGCNKLSQVYFPDTVRVIGTQSFAGCPISHLNLDHVETIGLGALVNTRLEEIITTSLKTLGTSSLFSNEKLKRLVTPNLENIDNFSIGLTKFDVFIAPKCRYAFAIPVYDFAVVRWDSLDVPSCKMVLYADLGRASKLFVVHPKVEPPVRYRLHGRAVGDTDCLCTGGGGLPALVHKVIDEEYPVHGNAGHFRRQRRLIFPHSLARTLCRTVKAKFGHLLIRPREHRPTETRIPADHHHHHPPPLQIVDGIG